MLEFQAYRTIRAKKNVVLCLNRAHANKNIFFIVKVHFARLLFIGCQSKIKQSLIGPNFNYVRLSTKKKSIKKNNLISPLTRRNTSDEK
jgi:hypothetical protein